MLKCPIQERDSNSNRRSKEFLGSHQWKVQDDSCVIDLESNWSMIKQEGSQVGSAAERCL